MFATRSTFSATTTSARRRGFSLIELLVSLTIFGVVMTAATRQLIEGVKLSLKTAQVLEIEGSSRSLIDRLNDDVRSAEVLTIHPGFDDRSEAIVHGDYGNYVVMHRLDGTGAVTRTIGYYLQSNGADGSWALFRHDSENGTLTPGTLPDVTTGGSHHRLVSTVRMPEEVELFRAWGKRGFTLRGQFGAPQGAPAGRLEYIQCTLTTRS